MQGHNFDFFEIFPWNKNFETGIELIDEQHQQLVQLLNRLAAHLANRSGAVTLNNVFNDLADYIDCHFKTEENLWLTYFPNDEWLANHQATHYDFVREINKLREEEGVKPFDDVIGGILKYLTHWLAYHILDTDKRMSKAVLGLQAGLTIQQAKQQSDLEMNGAMKVLIDTVLNMYDCLSVRTLDLMREKSERKRVESALRVSEERWQFILEGLGDQIWEWESIGGDPLINRDSKAILNIIYSEYKQAGATVQIHPDDLARVAENLQDHLNGVSDSFYNEHRLLHADGSWSWVASRAKVTSRDALGCPLRMIGMNADITERKLAHMVFQNASEAIMITDADNQIVSVNPAFTRISGYSLREVLGRNPKKFSSSRQSEKTYQTIFQSLNTVGNWQGEIWNRRRNGEIYPSWVAINTVFNPDNSVHYRIIQFHDITHKKQDEELIWKQANFDELTGLPNRHMLHERLCGEIKKQRRNRLKMAVIFLDLDHFKEVNDALGHFQGDALLLEASQRIASCVRESDTVARLGGDEFTVILANLNDTSHVQRVTEDILSKLSAPFQLENEMVYVSASIGVTIFPDDGTEVITLLKNADQAMYFAKNQGRNRCCYFTKSMQEASQLKIRLANDLRQGLEKEQFILHYQPIVELGAGHILKAEALLRWAHPLHGIISPASFIPIAEETGLIVEIGNWVFRQAAHQAALWRDTYHIDLQISINKSPVQFRSDRHNPGAWFEYLTELGLTGQSLVVEITEGLLMDNDEVVNNQLLTFRDTGIQVALDDFGTGFSALSYLNKFDIDYIKIDQSFTRNLALGSDELALCEAIIVMAHKLGIKVIAEGIETQNQCDLLLAAGCDYGQGYLFSKPVSAIEFARFLAPPTNK